MGENHLKKYLSLPNVEVVGFYDNNLSRAKEVSEQYQLTAFNDLETLFYEADAVSIATATPFHFSVAKKALESGVHILVEKPVTETSGEADELIEIALRNGLQFQVGYVERFRLLALLADLPAFVPTHIQLGRLNTSLGREPDRDVITDLMVHDIDLSNFLMRDIPSSHMVSACSVLTGNWDEALATLVYPSGTVATITSSRVASTLARGLRILGEGTSLDLDFVKNTVKGFYRDPAGVTRGFEKTYQPLDPLLNEISAFVSCIQGVERIHVTGREAKLVGETAMALLESLPSAKPFPGTTRSPEIKSILPAVN